MMLEPSMKELLDHIDNRYLLVNVAAKRARDIADNAAECDLKLSQKPVKLALNDIMEDKIVPYLASAEENNE